MLPCGLRQGNLLEGDMMRRRSRYMEGRGGLGRVVSSSSSASSSGYGRQSQAVAVVSLDCDAVDSDLYIGA
jgi:hypothetical protein